MLKVSINKVQDGVVVARELTRSHHFMNAVIRATEAAIRHDRSYLTTDDGVTFELAVKPDAKVYVVSKGRYEINVEPATPPTYDADDIPSRPDPTEPAPGL